MPDNINISKINDLMADLSVEDRLKSISSLVKKPVFTTSLSREDQFLLWQILFSGSEIEIATLQTGRLFNETLTLLDITKTRYGIDIKIVEPDPEAVETYVENYGENGFYNSVEARHLCCDIRKVDPLTKLLKNSDGWVTGLMRDQSSGRSEIPFVEWDEQHKLLKFNPLADVQSAHIESEIFAHEIPVNPLHSQGYPSIGCEPCTRAIKTGEHPRAGRWWWENNSSSECGLHVERQSA